MNLKAKFFFVRLSAFFMVFAVWLITLHETAVGKTYKWTDEKGVTYISDSQFDAQKSSQVQTSENYSRQGKGDSGDAMAYVKGGCYEMGDTFGDGAASEKPIHEVCLDPF